MKTLLSLLFFGIMAGTTASVATKLDGSIETSAAGSFKAFGVNQSGKAVIITWAASSENIDHFMIERSNDGKLFERVMNISYTSANAFKYTDQITDRGFVHYRIAAVKKQGTIEYSSVKKVRTAGRR